MTYAEKCRRALSRRRRAADDLVVPRPPRLATRGVRRLRRRSDHEAGFTLIEMMVALGILALVLPAFFEGFVVSTSSTKAAQLKEVAVTLADSAIDKIRTTAPATLLAGTAVTPPVAGVDLSQTASPVSDGVTTATLDGHGFTTTTYAGTCYLQPPPAGQTNAVCTTGPSNYQRMVRVIAAVAWSATSGCSNQACSFTEATLISNFADSTLETNPNVVPVAPANVTASPGFSQATVSWSPSSSTFPVTGYVAVASPGGASCSTNGATSCTIPNLTGGTTYSVTVTAVSQAGTSAASAPATVTPWQAVPTAPTGVSATPGQTSATVSWSAVSAVPAVTGYTATASPGGATCTTTGALSCSIPGLAYGTTYSITVTASSPAGTSPASSPVTVSPTGVPPTAPTGVKAVPGESSSAISWAAVSAAPPVASYTATASPGGATCTSATTTCSLTGLTDGVTYSVTVVAKSAAGTSPASTAVTTIPYPAAIFTSTNGLALWLDAANPASFTGDGCSAATVPAAGAGVSCWGDGSPSATPVSQSAASNQPLMTSLNGHTALSFIDTSTSATRYLTTAGSGGTYQTVFVAVAPTSNAPNAAFEMPGVPTAVRLGYVNSQQPVYDWGYGGQEMTNGTANGAASAGSTYVVSDVASSAHQGSVTIGDTFAGGVYTQGLNGTLGEVVAFKGTLTTAQISAVSAYLTNKWG